MAVSVVPTMKGRDLFNTEQWQRGIQKMRLKMQSTRQVLARTGNDMLFMHAFDSRSTWL